MKKFYIIDTKDNNKVVDILEASNEGAARKLATRNHLQLVLTGGIVVASENRYNLHYRNK